MSIKHVRQDEDDEKLLERVKRATGWSESEAIRRGLQSTDRRLRERPSTRAFDIYPYKSGFQVPNCNDDKSTQVFGGVSAVNVGNRSSILMGVLRYSSLDILKYYSRTADRGWKPLLRVVIGVRSAIDRRLATSAKQREPYR